MTSRPIPVVTCPLPSMTSVRRLVVAMLVLGCVPKDETYFELQRIAGPLVDITPPIISLLQPATDVYLNDTDLGFNAFDGIGLPKAPVSGLNIAGILARTGAGIALPVRQGGEPDRFFIDIRALQDGPYTVNLKAPDFAGNIADASYAFRLRRRAPTFTYSLQPVGATTQANSSANWTVSYEAAVERAAVYLRERLNGTCARSNPLIPIGTNPFSVSQNTFDLKFAPSFSYSLRGVPNDQRPARKEICVDFQLADGAVARDGTPMPNTTEEMVVVEHVFEPEQVGSIAGRVMLHDTTPMSGVTVSIGNRTTVTDNQGRYSFTGVIPGTYVVSLQNLPSSLVCEPGPTNAVVKVNETATVNFNCREPDFFFTPQLSFVHVVAGESYVCLTTTVTEGAFTVSDANGLPAVAGSSWSVSWTGPGVVGATLRTGTLDAAGKMLDRQRINRFGTYTATLSVTANGRTKQATGEVTVGAAQGTCTPP